MIFIQWPLWKEFGQTQTSLNWTDCQTLHRWFVVFLQFGKDTSSAMLIWEGIVDLSRSTLRDVKKKSGFSHLEQWETFGSRWLPATKSRTKSALPSSGESGKRNTRIWSLGLQAHIHFAQYAYDTRFSSAKWGGIWRRAMRSVIFSICICSVSTPTAASTGGWGLGQGCGQQMFA